jgi:hypothetical protein
LGPCRTSSFAIDASSGRAAVCLKPAMLSSSPKFALF